MSHGPLLEIYQDLTRFCQWCCSTIDTVPAAAWFDLSAYGIFQSRCVRCAWGIVIPVFPHSRPFATVIVQKFENKTKLSPIVRLRGRASSQRGVICISWPLFLPKQRSQPIIFGKFPLFSVGRTIGEFILFRFPRLVPAIHFFNGKFWCSRRIILAISSNRLHSVGCRRLLAPGGPGECEEMDVHSGTAPLSLGYMILENLFCSCFSQSPNIEIKCHKSVIKSKFKCIELSIWIF